jgi:radical SAM protein with 4Fe4S-binding SPASM domain
MNIPITSITLEIMALCNLKCKICPTGRGEIVRGTRTMCMDLIDKIVMENRGATRINLNNWGEPLLHYEFEKILKLINSELPECKIYFATNATLLNKDITNMILKYNIHEIQFSVDGVGEVYSDIREIDYEYVKKNILEFIKAKYKVGNKVKLVLKAVINKETEPNLDILLNDWKGVIDVRCQPEIKYDSSHIRRTPCPELFNNHLVVLSDGRVTPCCSDYNGALCMGFANQDNTLEAIWNSERAQRFRKAHESGRYPKFCLKCSEYETDKCRRRFE